jgi:hypothetical protein
MAVLIFATGICLVAVAVQWPGEQQGEWIKSGRHAAPGDLTTRTRIQKADPRTYESVDQGLALKKEAGLFWRF